MIQFDFTTELAPPVNNVCDIFKALIERTAISERDFNQNGFRSRLTDIREALAPEGITVHFATEEFINPHGRKRSYRKHFLLECEKEKATEIYNRLNVK
jgi:hypothetical protein